MNLPNDGITKKRIIAFLLFVSCITSILILVYTSDDVDQQLQSLGQADSLIVQTFAEFNISSNQYSESTVRVDSNLVRKTFTVDVPPRFSKTLLHAELNRIFHPLGVRTPARTNLPDQLMTIHLMTGGTVFRTIELQSDDELVMERDIASIIIAFEEAPSDDLIESVIRFGEPIPIALRVADAEQAREQLVNIEPNYPHVSFWHATGDAPLSPEPDLPPASFLDDVPAGASVLQFMGSLSSAGAPFVSAASENSITFLDVSDATVLHSDLGESVFKKELDKLATSARQQQHPVAIIIASEESLEWLREKLITYKKSGFYLAYPPQTKY